MNALLSLRKSLNYALVGLQKRLRTPVVFGYPCWLTLDPGSVCRLRCPLCPTGRGEASRPRTLMPAAEFRRIIDTLGPYLVHADLCNWGEPLLNRELPSLIAYMQRYGITTRVDTSLNVELDGGYAEELLRSGLTMLTLSIDGASRETYGRYRRGGDFDAVMGNARLLAEKKRGLGLRGPHLHWQFLVFRHNEHEIEDAKRLARSLGLDSIGFGAPYCPPEMASSLPEYRRPPAQEDTPGAAAGRCNWLWDAVTVNADGSVSPCCSVEDRNDDFGGFFEQPFRRLWNGKKYRDARRSAGRGETACARCAHAGAGGHFEVSPARHGKARGGGMLLIDEKKSAGALFRFGAGEE